jgi:sodium-dependent dicarboxylate transporter 2/3/5
VLGNHLLVHPGSVCGFSVHGAPCRFCLEGARGPTDRGSIPTVADVVDVVRAAFDEGVASLVYVNGSPFEAEDGGMAFLAPYVEAIRKHFDTIVAVQVHPPKALSWIDRTYAMGVDALSFNLEIFDPDLLNRYCIGRSRYVGRERYLEALAHAAKVFPGGTVWTDLVVGLEPLESTIEGIDTLTGMGVLPVIAMRRPVTAERSTIAPADVAPLLSHLHRAVRAQGIPMGWVGDLTLGISPLEAREFAGDDARMALAMRQLTRWRLGALAARGLARVRRRLRVRDGSDGIDLEH